MGSLVLEDAASTWEDGQALQQRVVFCSVDSPHCVFVGSPISGGWVVPASGGAERRCRERGCTDSCLPLVSVLPGVACSSGGIAVLCLTWGKG